MRFSFICQVLYAHVLVKALVIQVPVNTMDVFTGTVTI